MTLRSTSLRDTNGDMWHIPNGEITFVANKSQVWARALLDIEVAYESDLRAAQEIIAGVAAGVWSEPEFEDVILEAPEVWGVQNLGADGVAIRLVVKTVPASQWSVERELRLRIKEALDAAGVEIPYPQRTVWLREPSSQ
jgi:small-conductance mechanosensitive channel